jgi:hypothetical protein
MKALRTALLALVVALTLLAGGGMPAYAWTPPAALNTNAASDSGGDALPQVTTDGAGNWVAVWQSYQDIQVARSTDNGATWTYPAALNTNSGSDMYPQVTTDGAGNWVAVWDSGGDPYSPLGPDRDILVSRSTDNGVNWTPAAALNTNAGHDGGDDKWCQVTTDGLGNWVAVWNSNTNLGGNDGPDWDILVARSADNGASWTTPAALSSYAFVDSNGEVMPQVATDGGGNWVAVWKCANGLVDTIGYDGDIVVSRSTDNGATWTTPVALNTNAGSDSGADEYPQVTTDGGGHWLAVWKSYDTLGGTIGTDGDILAARSTDNGATWTAPAALNGNAATDSGDDLNPQVTTDGAGNWVAVWACGLNDFTDFDILLARSTNNGATWTAPAALNTNAGSDSGGDWDPQVTTDGAGNWVAVWDSDDSLGGTIGTDYDILVARFTDHDGDGYDNAEDNCSETPNPGQEDADSDGVGDACDNCPATANSGQTNADGDAWGDACDYCPTTATPWHTPAGDDDCDGFTSDAEGDMGTDPADACPDALDDDAWPVDLNAGMGCGQHDGKVNITDVLCFKGKLAHQGPYDSRYDLNADGSVNIIDVLLYKPFIKTSCTNP